MYFQHSPLSSSWPRCATSLRRSTPTLTKAKSRHGSAVSLFSSNAPRNMLLQLKWPSRASCFRTSLRTAKACMKGRLCAALESTKGKCPRITPTDANALTCNLVRRASTPAQFFLISANAVASRIIATDLCQLIGIGRGLTASPLPHHRTDGSRIRRFGRLSQGETLPQPERSAPGVPAVSSSQMLGLAQHLARCDLTTPPQATTPLSRSGLQHTIACLRCRLLTAAGRSGRIAPPSVLREDTPQISRGKLSHLPCIGARFIKHSPLVDGGLCSRVPARPDWSHTSYSVRVPRPHVRSTRPSDPTSR